MRTVRFFFLVTRINVSPIAHIRKRLAAFGWRGERLNNEVARIVAGPDDKSMQTGNCNIIFPYGWEKKQLTREVRRMFSRKTGRRMLIMLDELHQFFNSRDSLACIV